MEQVQEKRPVRRSSERRMEISDKVSTQRPDEWHEDIRDIKEKQEEPKTPVENKVGGGMTEQLFILLDIHVSKITLLFTDERGEEGGESVLHF